MEPTDFGIDLTTLPKLVLNEDRGRKMFERLLSVKAFRLGLNLSKEVYFRHYLEVHLDVQAADFDTDIDIKRWQERLKVLKKDHELVWTTIDGIVNRHVFLIVTAWSSLEENVINDDEREFVRCNAYMTSFSSILNASIEVDDIAAYVARGIRSGDMMQTIERTVAAAANVDKAANRMRTVMRQYVKDATENIDYGIGLPVHRRPR